MCVRTILIDKFECTKESETWIFFLNLSKHYMDP